VVGDDDEVRDDAVGYVLDSLKERPDLNAMILNFSVSGRATFDRCSKSRKTRWSKAMSLWRSDIRAADPYFSLAFMTAQIYRSKLARLATGSWPHGTWNYDTSSS
jgi:hypothetical protein